MHRNTGTHVATWNVLLSIWMLDVWVRGWQGLLGRERVWGKEMLWGELACA